MTNGKIVFLAVPVYSECWIMLPLNFLGKSNNIFWPLKTFRKILWVPDDYPPKKRTQTKRAKPNKLVRDFQIQERQLFCTLTCHCGTLLHFIRRKKSCELCFVLDHIVIVFDLFLAQDCCCRLCQEALQDQLSAYIWPPVMSGRHTKKE